MSKPTNSTIEYCKASVPIPPTVFKNNIHIFKLLKEMSKPTQNKEVVFCTCFDPNHHFFVSYDEGMNTADFEIKKVDYGFLNKLKHALRYLFWQESFYQNLVIADKSEAEKLIKVLSKIK